MTDVGYSWVYARHASERHLRHSHSNDMDSWTQARHRPNLRTRPSLILLSMTVALLEIGAMIKNCGCASRGLPRRLI
jgi:hypothetical protein